MVVGPYNSVLTLERLIEYPDVVVVLDNQALYRVANDTMRVQTPSLEHINSMVSRIMNCMTAPMRFYSPVYTRMAHMAAYLNPFPPMQFIQTGEFDSNQFDFMDLFVKLTLRSFRQTPNLLQTLRRAKSCRELWSRNR